MHSHRLHQARLERIVVLPCSRRARDTPQSIMRHPAPHPAINLPHLRCQSKVTLTGRRVRCDKALYHSGGQHTAVLPWTRTDPRGADEITWQGVPSGTETYFDPHDADLVPWR